MSRWQSFVLCKILSIKSALHKNNHNTSGSNSLGQLHVLCSFSIQSLCFCSSIRNCIAYAKEENIVNKPTNLVFCLSKSRKRKHRTVSVGNCTATCFSVICYCAVFYFSESDSTNCTWRLVGERKTAVGLSCKIHGEHLTGWIRQRYSTNKNSCFVIVLTKSC